VAAAAVVVGIKEGMIVPVKAVKGIEGANRNNVKIVSKYESSNSNIEREPEEIRCKVGTCLR
jgi:hypothetical protein